MDWMLIAYIAFMAIVVFLTLFWVLPSFFRWLLFPEKPSEGEAPEGSYAHEMEEAEQAVFAVREAIAAELLPVLERVVERLNRILR